MHPPGGREVMGTTRGCGPPRGPDASRRRGLLVAALLSGVGCGTDGGVTPAPTPAILASAVADNPSNVLSAVVTGRVRDRKSTRLNSSHGYISYAVFCLKKKKITRLSSD